MANKINFITGETYTLEELFSGERYIIIPDLQRDYCWGDETNQKSTGEVGELVSDFIISLIEQYDTKEHGVLNLGLFYGYEIPVNHIQLCDGQQRLTTLFLLLGMLNKKCGKFRHYLISDYEYKHDDKEPYLNYAIRETSLYFLSDLVCNFFISNNDRVDAIKEADWYFSDYNLDPSIQSMLNALSKIEALLSDKDPDWIISFGNWIVNKLTFLYFDMQNRKNGEETFVVINTTGESLSATQNLKPLVIQEKNKLFDNTIFKTKLQNGDIVSIDCCWEQIETWFWRNRQGDNDTADAGFAEFLRWVSILEQYKEQLPNDEQTDDIKYLIQNILQGKGKIEFPYKRIPFEKVYGYWESLAWIYENFDELSFSKEYLSPDYNRSVNNRKAIGQNDCFVLLPVLKYVQGKINIDIASEIDKRNIVRVYNFFKNVIRIDNVSKAVNTLVGEALNIIDLIDDGDITSILCKPDVSKQILTKEEIWKLEIIKDSSDRYEVEEAFWKLQKHPIWDGKILPIIEMSSDEQQLFDFDKFKNYSEVFYLLFSGDVEHESVIRNLRRCMIVAADSYEPISRGDYASFAWEWKDWKDLLSRNVNETRKLFDYIIANLNKQPIETILETYIAQFIVLTKKYSEFAIDNYLLNFTRNAKSCDMIWEMMDWQISITGGTGRHTSFFSRYNANIMKEYGATWENTCRKKYVLENKKWRVWYWPASHRYNCVVFEDDKVKLDVRYLAERNACEIVLKALDENYDITSLASKLGFEMKESQIEAIIIQFMDSFDSEKIKEKLSAIMKNLSEIEDNLIEPGD